MLDYRGRSWSVRLLFRTIATLFAAAYSLVALPLAFVCFVGGFVCLKYPANNPAWGWCLLPLGVGLVVVWVLGLEQLGRAVGLGPGARAENPPAGASATSPAAGNHANGDALKG